MERTCLSQAAADESDGSLGSSPTIVDVRCGCAAHRSPQADRVRRARIRALQEPEAQAIAVGRIGTTGAACLAVILDVPRAGLPGAASDLLRAPAAAAPCPPARCPRGDSAPMGESRPWQVRKSLQSCTEAQPFP